MLCESVEPFQTFLLTVLKCVVKRSPFVVKWGKKGHCLACLCMRRLKVDNFAFFLRLYAAFVALSCKRMGQKGKVEVLLEN